MKYNVWSWYLDHSIKEFISRVEASVNEKLNMIFNYCMSLANGLFENTLKASLLEISFKTTSCKINSEFNI